MMTVINRDNSESIDGMLVESIKCGGLSGILQEYAELGIDRIIDDGLLKDVPIVGTLTGMFKTIGSIRDRQYLKKLISFLKHVDETTLEQRESFIRENCQDAKKFEEAILLMLEIADRYEKASLMGKIFKASFQGQISCRDAIKLSSMVNRAFWEDIEQLVENVNVQIDDNNQSLVNAGLFEVSVQGGGYRARYSSANIHYVITNYGKHLNQIANG